MSDIIKNNAALSISVDDGMREVPITNKLGRQIGTFYFRPTDVGIIDRYNEAVTKIPDIFKPLENININPEGETSTDAEMIVLREAEEKLYEVCNYLFGGNLSEAFFGEMHPFSPLEGGIFYCENALESVGNFISAQFKRNVQNVEKRVSRYTKGYGAKRITGQNKNA